MWIAFVHVWDRVHSWTLLKAVDFDEPSNSIKRWEFIEQLKGFCLLKDFD
jgi:hypothetical protein